MAVSVEVRGDYACFSRPEMKVERVSYDVMTPSAARGLLEAIYWHPGMVWIIDRIHVCNPIVFTNIRRNEVSERISARKVQAVMKGGSDSLYLATPEIIQQRAAMVLKDVRYVIDAHFEMTPKASDADNPSKFAAIMRRRLERGQCYHQPCFGVREFPAYFAACDDVPQCHESLRGEKDLGWMLLDMDYSDTENIRPKFFRAVLRNGVLDVPRMDDEGVAE